MSAPHPGYAGITETPGAALNAEQWRRLHQRYALGAQYAGGRRVLEVSCGAGLGLVALAAVASQVVGLDYTFAVLRHPQAHARTPLLCADAQRLPFAAASFDLILNFEAIYYLPRPADFLQESRRLLAPQGRLFLCTSNPDWPYFAAGPLSVHYPTVPELRALLAAAGFTAMHMWGAFPLAAYRGRQRLVSRLRNLALRLPLRLASGPWAAWLQRLAYARLTPIPATLAPADLAAALREGDLTPLDPAQPDRLHRVIYALAEAT